MYKQTFVKLTFHFLTTFSLSATPSPNPCLVKFFTNLLFLGQEGIKSFSFCSCVWSLLNFLCVCKNSINFVCFSLVNISLSV